MSNALLRFDAAVEDLLAMREFNPENIKPDEGCKDTLFELKGLVDTGVISPELYRELKKVLSNETCVYSPYVGADYVTGKLESVKPKTLDEALNIIADAYEDWANEEFEKEEWARLDYGSKFSCWEIKNVYNCHCDGDICVCNTRLGTIDEEPPIVMVCRDGVAETLALKDAISEYEEYIPEIEELVDKYFPYAKKIVDEEISGLELEV